MQERPRIHDTYLLSGAVLNFALTLSALAVYGCSREQTLGASCEAPLEEHAAPLELAEPLDRFAGHYSLTVIETSGYPGDTIAHGDLWLVPTDSAHRPAGPPERTSPMYGWSSIDLKSLAPVSLLYSPSVRDQDRPGVQMIHDAKDRNLVMIFGNAESDTGVTTDIGVVFFVYSIDSLGFKGRWVDGGLRRPLPSGYFCGVRSSDSPSARSPDA
jgi:hypothetical protein